VRHTTLALTWKAGSLTDPRIGLTPSGPPSYVATMVPSLRTGGFAQRFAALRAQRGPLCLGLDPSPELLAAWGLKDDVWGLRNFCNRVIDAAAQHVSVIKPQSAYFERLGAAGLEVLADIIGSIHAIGSLSLLDVKRGDIGATNSAYASALLGPDSALGADAITVHAYLGFGALEPFLTRVQATGCGLFVVVLSSNPEGRAIQHALVQPGVTVAQHLCAEITAYNARVCPEGTGPVGAVVGLTADGASEIASRLPRSLLLAPGLGAQGGTFEQAAVSFGSARERVLPSASRSLLAHGPDLPALQHAIREHCARATEALG
jgi:orotidine-5'-phosphate decarboxylase